MSIIKMQDNLKVNDEDIKEYKMFASEFDRAMLYNIFKEERLTKIEFVKVMIDLGFIHSQKLDLKFMVEFAMNLPMI